ncbi:MAG TPA: HlyD family efflux transporter periplasmic adaptor subunit [Phycisphaerae bacterium]|jgi:biotin carboxyl carrier protein
MMRSIVKWAGALLCVGLGGWLALGFVERHAKADEEERAGAAKEKKEAAKAPVTLSRDDEGQVVLTLSDEAREHIDLETVALAAVELRPEIRGYGRLEEDPARGFAVRAPVAGIVRGAPDAHWPNLGERIKDGYVIGVVEPRLSAAERVDLAARLASARAEADEAAASLAASRASYENKKKLNAGAQIVSDRTLEETEAKVKSDEARMTAAQETVQLIEAAVTGATGDAGRLPIKVESGGEVVELLARPGEAVESGQPLLRVQRFDRLVARVELPVGSAVDGDVTGARVLLAGHEHDSLRSQQVSPSSMGTGAHGPMYVISLEPDRFSLRPGMPLSAYLETSGEARQGVTIPRSAVVRFAAKAWAYVQTGEDQFTRRELELETPVADGWFTNKGFTGEERIVVRGAQALLSAELVTQTGAEQPEEE